MATKKFTRITGAMQSSALKETEHDRLFGGSRRGMRLVEPRVEEVDVNPDQPRRRFDGDALRALADSLLQHGQKQPVGVKRQDDGRWMLVFGERRLRACVMAGIPTIQAVVTDGDPLEIALIENVQREGLTIFETADAYEALMSRKGYNQSTLARVVGTTPSAITRLMAVRSLDPAIRREYDEAPEAVSRSALIEIADLRDAQARLDAWHLAKAGATIKELREFKASLAAPSPTPPDIQQADPVSEIGIGAAVGESSPDQKSDKAKTADSFAKSVLQLEKAFKPFVEGRERLDAERRRRLEALRDQINRLLAG